MCLTCCRRGEERRRQDTGVELLSSGQQPDPEVQPPSRTYLLPNLDPHFVEEIPNVPPRRCCQYLRGLQGFFEFMFVDPGAEIDLMNARTISAEQRAEVADR